MGNGVGNTLGFTFANRVVSPVMLSVRNENLSATVEAFFSAPVPFDRSRLAATAAVALRQFSEYGLRPGQISQRLGDQLLVHGPV